MCVCIQCRFMHVSKCSFKVLRLLNKLSYSESSTLYMLRSVHDNILSCGCHGNIFSSCGAPSLLPSKTWHQTVLYGLHAVCTCGMSQ